MGQAEAVLVVMCILYFVSDLACPSVSHGVRSQRIFFSFIISFIFFSVIDAAH